jgi:hypothetical protein
VEVDEVELRRYLAVFERIGVLLGEGYMAPAVLDRLYGSRFEKLVTKRDGSYVDLVRESPGAWRDFLVIWKHLSAFREIPSPPSP